MEGLFFNVDAGYAEALVRGFRAGLLTTTQYANMTQCDSLDDLRLQLQATEYGDFMSNLPTPLTTRQFQDRSFERVVAQFREIQSSAVEPLSQFLDYITYSYMIDNVVLLISGTAHQRDTQSLLSRAHPLGWFDTLPALTVAQDLAGLYETVLVDTPLAAYFKEVVSVEELTDLSIEVVRNRLYKAYIEDFAQWVETTLAEPSKSTMLRFLAFEADRRAINVSLNSLKTELTAQERESLLPSLGSLYPTATHQLARADDPDQVRQVIETYGSSDFETIWDSTNERTLEDHFYELEMELCREALTQQFTYSTFYAWLKAAEQEVRNVTWIAECIAQNQKQRISNYISVF